MASPAPAKIRFGTFELDVTSGELRKSGILLKLQPQPFRVLLLLIDKAGQVVTREEIQRCLWTDSTFVDFEHGINFSINQIRGSLSDNAEGPRYIETLPKRGYRFIGTVVGESAKPPAADPEPQDAIDDTAKTTTLPPRIGNRRVYALALESGSALTTASGSPVVVEAGETTQNLVGAGCRLDAFADGSGGVRHLFLLQPHGRRAI